MWSYPTKVSTDPTFFHPPFMMLAMDAAFYKAQAMLPHEKWNLPIVSTTPNETNVKGPMMQIIKAFILK